MTVIDIHSHMFGRNWLQMLKSHGAPDYGSEKLGDGRTYLMEKGAAACAFEEEAFDDSITEISATKIREKMRDEGDL